MAAFNLREAQVRHATAGTALALHFVPWDKPPITACFLAAEAAIFAPHVLVLFYPNGQYAHLWVERFCAQCPARALDEGIDDGLTTSSTSSVFPVRRVRLLLRGTDVTVAATAAALGEQLRVFEYNHVRAMPDTGSVLPTVSTRLLADPALVELPTAELVVEDAYTHCFACLREEVAPTSSDVFFAVLSLVRLHGDHSTNVNYFAAWLAKAARRWPLGATRRLRPPINIGSDVALSAFFLSHDPDNPVLTHASGPAVASLMSTKALKRLHAWRLQLGVYHALQPLFALPFEQATSFLRADELSPEMLLIGGFVVVPDCKLLIHNALAALVKKTQLLVQPLAALIAERLDRDDDIWQQLLNPVGAWPSLAAFPFEHNQRQRAGPMALTRLQHADPATLPACLVDAFSHLQKGVAKNEARLWIGCLAGQLDTSASELDQIGCNLSAKRLGDIKYIANKHYGRKLLLCRSTCFTCSTDCPIYHADSYRSVLDHPALVSICTEP
jgi:hypothetical protein